jgi:hypothetical protein
MPRTPHQALLLPGSYDAPLFEDEAARLDAAAREKVATQNVAPVAIVDDAEIGKLRALVKAGRVREGGPKCARPPKLERAVRMHYRDAWAVQAETACMGSQCTLWLFVREPKGLLGWDHAREWPVLVEASENVTAVTDVAAFEAAMRGIEFARHEQGVEGGMMGGIGRGFGMGSGGPPHRHLVIDVEGAGPWAAAPFTKDLAGDQKRFDACPASDQMFEELLIDVDASGKVDRCAGAAHCLCDVIRGHRFEAGKPLRRARVRFGHDGGSGGLGFGSGKVGLGGKTRDFFVHLRGHGSEFDDDFDVMRASEKPLAACFTATPSPKRFDAKVAMTVDESGVVKAASVTQGRDELTDKEAACVTAWARALRFSCETVAGTADVTALLAISR